VTGKIRSQNNAVMAGLDPLLSGSVLGVSGRGGSTG
jgi:hypothetical protein